ncbi:MAG TPA: polymer-forming cytoskeletal protein [Candidatus Acidoferrum sp.]|nr:polymer-forming cytoskeletal protein [Candidatus Acidoferrum sp.]
MWRKEDAKPQSGEPLATPAASPSVAPVPSSPASPKTNASPAASVPAASVRSGASISQGIKIKGELTGSEDLYVDGIVEGKLNLSNGVLTIGPNGTVKADVDAREVMISGRIDGNINAREKIQLWSTGQVSGEVRTERLAIEEGATLRGKVEAGKAPAKAAAAAAKGFSGSNTAAD